MSVCLSVCLFVCPVCPVPSRPRKKVAETENFAKQSCQIYFKGDKKNTQSHAAVLGEAKPSYIYSILKPHFRVSSPPQSWSQAVVCISTPRKYSRSGYFLVAYNSANTASYVVSYAIASFIYLAFIKFLRKWELTKMTTKHLFRRLLSNVRSFKKNSIQLAISHNACLLEGTLHCILL